MAKKQPGEASPPDPVRQVTDEVNRLEAEAGGTPQGAGAGPGAGADLARSLPALIPPFLEIAGKAQGGLGPDEAKRIAQVVHDAIQQLRAGG